MKTTNVAPKAGFTLVEILVVIAIMGVLMTMAASVLQNAGKGRGVESAVAQLEGLVREARATAIGNDTPTRIIFLDDASDRRPSSKHLRFANVLMLRKHDRAAGNYDGTSISTEGRWVSTSSGITFAPGVYFSPTYSKVLDWSEGEGDTMLGHESMMLVGRGSSRVYYVEFDEKGRFVGPMADPLNETRPQRLVVMNGKRSTSRSDRDGVKPSELDARKRPVGAKGIVIWPSGDTSLLRTSEQLE